MVNGHGTKEARERGERSREGRGRSEGGVIPTQDGILAVIIEVSALLTSVDGGNELARRCGMLSQDAT